MLVLCVFQGCPGHVLSTCFTTLQGLCVGSCRKLTCLKSKPYRKSARFQHMAARAATVSRHDGFALNLSLPFAATVGSSDRTLKPKNEMVDKVSTPIANHCYSYCQFVNNLFRFRPTWLQYACGRQRLSRESQAERPG